MSPRPGLLARGPWRPDQVEAVWREDAYEPPAEVDRMADGAVEGLRERGSPAHDGMATRLVAWDAGDDHLRLELQPVRWALRLLDDASDSLTALCVVRSEDGRWLAGRRAGWVSSWAGRWALGAGGAVDLGESPAETLTRELQEEWRLRPDDLSVEALVAPAERPQHARRPGHRAERLRARARTTSTTSGRGGRPDTADWPPEADDRLKLMADLLGS